MTLQARKQPGLTLIEMTIVVATIALLMTFAVPAVRALLNSFQSVGSTRSMISAALASARVMATRNQRYTGIRFQKACLSRDPTKPLDSLLDAPQYMVFIVHEEPRNMGNISNGFRAVEGLKPIRLPDMVGVMDLTDIIDITGDTDRNARINEDVELCNATSFAVIFSPSGKLVVHDVRTRNRDGLYQPNNDDSLKQSTDDVFNSTYNITIYNSTKNRKYGLGVFIQDDYPSLGLDPESSRTNFVIYERHEFDQAYKKGTAWSDYLARLSRDYISPYIGQIISSQ
jgi:type II secretory pathway pseudopilin PulG